jgi:hypothetical protein
MDLAQRPTKQAWDREISRDQVGYEYSHICHNHLCDKLGYTVLASGATNYSREKCLRNVYSSTLAQKKSKFKDVNARIKEARLQCPHIPKCFPSSTLPMGPNYISDFLDVSLKEWQKYGHLASRCPMCNFGLVKECPFPRSHKRVSFTALRRKTNIQKLILE